MVLRYPTFKEIAAEQTIAQSKMTIDRQLGSYTRNFFRCVTKTERRVLDGFLSEAVPGWDGQHSIKSLIETMEPNQSSKKTIWIDYGGGVGCAQAEALAGEPLRSKAHAINVDPLRHSLSKARHFMTSQPANLEYVQADAVKYRAKYPSQFASAMFVMPYVHDPLEFIANVYRNLDDAGLMVLATDDEYSWTRGIIDATPNDSSKRPVTRFLEALREADIHFAAIGYEGEDEEFGDDQEFSCLWLKKRPRTELEVVGDVVSIHTGRRWYDDHYKTVSYAGDPLQSPIKVVT